MSPEYDRYDAELGAYSDVLGEPVMVSNPMMITAAQAGAILGLKAHQVYVMVGNGLLEAHGAPNTVRRFLLADVKALAGPITLHEAAEILGCTVEKIHALLTAGVFSPTGNSLQPVRRVEVERRRVWKNPVRVPRPPRRGLQREDGTVNIRAAARILGLGVHRTRQLAAAELIPVSKDANGNYRFRLDHLELTAKAWRAAEENDRR